MSSLSFARKDLKQALLLLGGTAVGLVLLQVFGIDLAHAQLISPEDSPDNITTATGGEGSFKSLARQIVNFFLYFLGFIATIMVIYGGVLYVTSAGEEENVGKAKKILLYSVIGIVLILLSFAIVNTVLQAGTGTATNV